MKTEHDKYQVGVKALIVDANRLLMLKTTEFNAWEVPGGRINANESIHRALSRELAEELPGTRILRVGSILLAEQSNFRLKDGSRLLLLFYPVVARLPRILRISTEHSEFRWVSRDDIPMLSVQSNVRRAVSLVLR